MELTQLMLGELATNCYILNIGNQQAAAVDIGNGADKLLKELEKQNLQLKAILLTHGHYDHVSGVEEVRKATGADVYIHEKDAVMLESDRANLAWQLTNDMYHPVTEYHTLRGGEILGLGNQKIHVLHTPGHTPGGVCYLTETMMFCGDTIFKGSIGRIDLGGNQADMKASLRKIAALEKNYKIYPGHFESSTLEEEKLYNPYLRQFV
ncbi:MAG: MBL fold metallo-hydrolase [Oscillospiraceae bacterium]|nr:MBL fold metallo-hydrolase [Oscillospiraceae bacterium]